MRCTKSSKNAIKNRLVGRPCDSQCYKIMRNVQTAPFAECSRKKEDIKEKKEKKRKERWTFFNVFLGPVSVVTYAGQIPAVRVIAIINSVLMPRALITMISPDKTVRLPQAQGNVTSD